MGELIDMRTFFEIEKECRVGMRMFTIYENPRDSQFRYITREWTTNGHGTLLAGPKVYEGDDLDAARRAVPLQHDACFGRQAEDDPAVLETWM